MESWARSSASFATTALPVIGGMLAVPTLDSPDPRARSQIPSVLRNLAYCEANVAEGRWWTPFSYVFVHASGEHLVSNLLMLVPHASRVHDAFGDWWLGCFFGGAAVSALDTTSKRYQVVQSISAFFQMSDTPQVLAPAAELVDGVTRKVAEWIAPSIVRSTVYVGASSGVWALMGTSLCLSLEQFVRTIWDWRARGSAREADDPDIGSVARVALTHAVSVYVLCQQVASTATDVMRGRAGRNIDHAGHLDGFVFGVGCFVVLRLTCSGRRRLYPFSSRRAVDRHGVLR